MHSRLTSLVLSVALVAGLAACDPPPQWWPRTLSGEEVQQPREMVPVVGDWDDDGLDDILWYRANRWGGDHREELWLARPQGGFDRSISPFQVSGQYRPVVADLTGDGGDDIVWYSNEDAPSAAWRIHEGRVVERTTYYLPPGATWVATVPHAEGTDDIVFSGPFDGGQMIWETDRHDDAPAAHLVIYSGGGRGLPVTGDFDADGRGDVLLYTPGPASDRILWGRADGAADDVHITNISGLFAPLALDADGDGADDILWLAATHAPQATLWSGRPGRWFARSTQPTPDEYLTPGRQRSHEPGGRDTALLWSDGPDEAWRLGADGRATFRPAGDVLGFSPLVGHFSEGVRDDVYVWSGGGTARSRLLLSPAAPA